MYNITKWLTETEYIDIETGEIISKSYIDRHNYIIKGTKRIIKYLSNIYDTRKQKI